MKSWRVLLTMALLSVGAGSCGSATDKVSAPPAAATTAAASGSAPTDFAKADADKDNDFSAYDDKHHRELVDFGHAASAAERHTITTLIKRYYTAAAAGDGAAACSMLYRSFARAVPEDYGTSPPGPSYIQAKTCSGALTKLFAHFHGQIAAEFPILKVTHVRLRERNGLVLLSFQKLPERQISVIREGHTWRLDALLDSELP